MTLRSFAEILAEWQGGFRVNPGKSITIPEVPEEKIRKVYGGIPSAISCDQATFTFKEVRPGYYQVTIYWVD